MEMKVEPGIIDTDEWEEADRIALKEGYRKKPPQLTCLIVRLRRCHNRDIAWLCAYFHALKTNDHSVLVEEVISVAFLRR